VQTSRKVLTLIILAFFLAILFSYFIWFDLAELCLFPIALLLVYLAIFQTEKLFLSLAFLTPFSINIEEFSKSFGLFIPTEPLLFGLMLILLSFQFKTPFVDKQIWKHPIIISVLVFISWMFVSAITSSNVLVSFKFILSKLWFIVPILFFGTHFFKKEANRNWFIRLFIIATSCTIIYTLIHHSTYDFGEKAGHWVMSPFFKDHTIYGAIIAMIIPLLLSWYFSEKHAPLIQISLIGIIIIVFLGLYFSYTRAAWLIIAIFYSAIQLYYSWPADDKQTRIKIFGMILSLTTYFSHAFLNNFLDTDKAAIPVLAMCSIIIVLDLKRRQIR